MLKLHIKIILYYTLLISPQPAPPLDDGWNDFLGARLHAMRDASSGQLAMEPQMLDGLSFPLSFVWGLRLLMQSGALPGTDQLH